MSVACPPWALVTFAVPAAVDRVMQQKIVLPEFAAGAEPVGCEGLTTELVRDSYLKRRFS